MRNQYFGDKHDFFKYQYLRSTKQLEDFAIIFMLTSDKSEGKNRGYLQKEGYGEDQDLFHLLQQHFADEVITSNPHRNVTHASKLLPKASLHVAPFRNGERRAYFSNVLNIYHDKSQIFLDPNTGIGRQESSDHLLPSEIELLISANKVVHVYQHKWQRESKEGTRLAVQRLLPYNLVQILEIIPLPDGNSIFIFKPA